MSAKASSNRLTLLLVAVISAAIGFGAIYVIAGGGDNEGARESAGEVTREAVREAPRDAAGATPPAGTVAVAQPAPTGTAANGAASDGSVRAVGAALKSADGAPLNRGKMTTFVFKKTPEAFPENVRFNDTAGQAIGIEAFKGKVVLMNLWATWCAPCRKEMPDLDRLQAELGSDRFEVVAVSLDRGSPEKARAFLDEIGVKSLAFYHDPEARIGFKLMAIGMPTTLLIDANGLELGRLVGPAEWHSEDAQNLVKAAIAAQGG